MMYVAHKQNKSCYGPFSRPERPPGWVSSDENKWLEYLRFHCFTYSLWQTIWDTLGATMWESVLPHWRSNMESILLHYLHVQPECIEDMDTPDTKQAAVGREEVPTYNEDIWY